jgi:two-component system, response regulator PdtaR
MKALNILIVEDEALVAWDLKNQLTKAGYNIIGPYNNAVQALQAFERETVDLALLDIHIKGTQDGIDIAQAIRQTSNIPLIFLTAMSGKNFVERAKTVQPSAYLLKPYQAPALYISIEMALANFEAQQSASAVPPVASFYAASISASTSASVVVKYNAASAQKTVKDVFLIQQNFAIIKPQKVFVKINIHDIMYLEADHVYTKIYTTTDTFLLRTALQTILDKLECFPFQRIHRSFVVNMAQVERFDEENVFMLEKMLPIGKTHKQDFLNYFAKY